MIELLRVAGVIWQLVSLKCTRKESDSSEMSNIFRKRIKDTVNLPSVEVDYP